jgi:imidazolonepropionase
MNLLVHHIKELVPVRTDGAPHLTGSRMRELGIIRDASVVVRDGVIRWVGPSSELPPAVAKGLDIFDASSYVVLPGFVDAHTHLVFAGHRDLEFSMRAAGLGYQEIAQRGGGILNTVTATRDATKKDLKRSALRVLDDLLRHGTTTVEIKSGYGLDPASETKMMEVITDLSEEHLLTVVRTFLGAHAVPPEYRADPEGYVRLVIDRMLPHIAKRKLADFCDVFCENGYFTVDQSRRILTAARSFGLKLKIHADELAPSGGSELGAELGAVSADHLEHITSDGIRKIRDAGVVAVALPGVSFFLNHGYAPARAMIDEGVPLAIATDFNPGSCMSYSMPMMMTIACTHMRMSPEECIAAATINAAAALGLSDRVGSLEVGKEADLVCYDIPNYRFLAYHFGTNHASKIIKRGTLLEF